ncbi:MAG: hypothetical protein LC122_12845 [Chitinophagales bacterium]|nr:hypothetical protein [Chitinophagales bacterium]
MKDNKEEVQIIENQENNSKAKRVLSEEHKKKISESSMGKPGTNTGKIFDDEWKKNISDSLTGRKISEEVKKNMSDAHKGHVAPNRKLNFEIAEKIREEYSFGSITQKELGKKYGISQNCVFDIIKRKTYNK